MPDRRQRRPRLAREGDRDGGDGGGDRQPPQLDPGMYAAEPSRAKMELKSWLPQNI
jgi:hypothetical protein